MSKRPIPLLPPITYPEIEYDDLLVIVNSNRTKRVGIADLFTAGYLHSTINKFTSNTHIGHSTDLDYSTLSVIVGNALSDRKIVFGGNPDDATDDNLVTSFGDIYVDDPFVFRTSSSDSSIWAAASSKISLLDGTTQSILYTNSEGNLRPTRVIESSTISINYDAENDSISFSKKPGEELQGDITISNNWITYDASYLANSGISLSQLDTLAICPTGHERYIQTIGLLEEGTTHVANCALSVWGNIYVDGSIAVSNVEGTAAGLGLGSLAFQDLDDVTITGGYIEGVDIHTGDFESTGIDDDGTATTIRIDTSNRVGIGTITPSEKLHVAGTIKSTKTVVANTSGDGIVQSMSIDGSSLIVKGAQTENYGIKLLCTTTTNSVHFTENIPLKFFNASTEVMKLSSEGRLSLGTPSTPWAILSCKGQEMASDSSISLVNNRTVGDSYSNVYFGDRNGEITNWIKVQHLEDGSDVNRMMFGVLNKEMLRITNDSTIEFKDSNETAKMIWDGNGAELRINGTKVWHAGNDGDGSGCDADLLDGQQGSWHRTWFNLLTKPTLQLTGDVTGSASFHIGAAETVVSLAAVVGDNTHRHNTTTIDGLDVVINDNIAAETILTKIKTVDGSGSGLDADTCDGQHLGTAANVQFNNLTITGTITETSDVRFKENIQPLTNALEVINMLNGVTFNKISTPDKKEHGFIAQEVEAIVPDVVETDEKGYKSINYSRLTALLVEAIKELSKKIDSR